MQRSIVNENIQNFMHIVFLFTCKKATDNARLFCTMVDFIGVITIQSDHNHDKSRQQQRSNLFIVKSEAEIR